jgi:hypothetical protein
MAVSSVVKSGQNPKNVILLPNSENRKSAQKSLD